MQLKKLVNGMAIKVTCTEKAFPRSLGQTDTPHNLECPPPLFPSLITHRCSVPNILPFW